MSPALRMLVIVLAGAVALAVVVPGVKRQQDAQAGVLTTTDGDTVDVTAAARAAGPAFAADVPAADRAWVRAALASARPEAARLIAEVDGLVRFSVFSAGPDAPLGVTRSDERGFDVSFNVAQLDGRHAYDRPTVVLHELGHVVDFALVPRALNQRLDAGIPRGGPCGAAIDCDRTEERFADTFAKWALLGAVSAAGAGYGIAAPPSLEDWGAPLADLAFRLPA
ncbi:MAG: hypothetical protein ACAH82_13650 [Solirubrobacteraceae bacterium]